VRVSLALVQELELKQQVRQQQVLAQKLEWM
jgi:hypothetical protein